MDPNDENDTKFSLICVSQGILNIVISIFLLVFKAVPLSFNPSTYMDLYFYFSCVIKIVSYVGLKTSSTQRNQFLLHFLDLVILYIPCGIVIKNEKSFLILIQYIPNVLIDCFRMWFVYMVLKYQNIMYE